MTRRRQSSGFTIIELMIVMTIIGVLSAIAIPSYNAYVTRAKVSEGIQVFAPAKQSIAEMQLMEGRFPASNGEAGLGSPTSYRGRYVGSMVVGAAGVVTVTFDDPALLGGSLFFTPTVQPSGALNWTCSTDIPHGLVPAECRN